MCQIPPRYRVGQPFLAVRRHSIKSLAGARKCITINANSVLGALHMPNWYRPLLAILVAALLASSPAFALQSPLSDEAIREAYFLGQRHDGSVERLLGKYIKQLPPPKTGPHISSVSLLTPFLQLAQF